MESVNEFITRQYRVYPPDVIPILPFATGAGLETFRKHFRFRDFAVEGAEFVFSGGIVAIAEDNLIVVNSVQVNAQRIILEVADNSQKCSIAFAVLGAYISGLDNERRLTSVEPLLLTHEAQCTVRLAFEWQHLLPDKASAFFASYAPGKLSSSQARARFAGLALRLTVRYDPIDSLLRDYGIAHGEKLFAIEPLANTPASERLYFTHSPLDSDTHLELVSEFEQAIMSGAARRRSRTS